MIRSVSILLAILTICGVAVAAGLPPGGHSKNPKYWAGIRKRVVNYTPLTFGGRIHSLTAHGIEVWFALGSTLEHVDPSGHITSYPMPAREWQVGGITTGPRGTVWFSAGQSGRIGFVDRAGHYHFEQLIPRKYFPDIRDLAVTEAGDVWFVDNGRRSFGHRTAAGRVIERQPSTGLAVPTKLAACGGRVWAATATPYGLGEFGTLTSRAALVPRALPIMRRGWIGAMTCDRIGRLWFTYWTPYSREEGRSRTFVGHIEAGGAAHFVDADFADAGGLTATKDGGIWISTSENRPGARVKLTRLDRREQRSEWEIPVFFASEAVVTDDGSLWFADNAGGSPIAVTRLF